MSLVIDADGHVEETLPELVDAIPSAMRDSAMQFVAEADGYVTYRIEGRLWRSKYPFPGGLQNHVSAGGVRREGGRDPKVRLQVLDDEGIDAAVLYPSVGLMFGLLEHPDIAAALCAAYNDWLARYCATDAKRLIGVALLPQHDPRLAAAELERAVDPRFRRRRNGPTGSAAAPSIIPTSTCWGKAQLLDVPSATRRIPGIDTIGLDRMSSYAGCHIVSHAFEQMAAMVNVTLAGSSNASTPCGFLEAAALAPTGTASKSTMSSRSATIAAETSTVSSAIGVAYVRDRGAGSGLDARAGWADNVMFAFTTRITTPSIRAREVRQGAGLGEARA
jgi:predicted TIM-barrel fold metal-dependent hydrolase